MLYDHDVCAKGRSRVRRQSSMLNDGKLTSTLSILMERGEKRDRREVALKQIRNDLNRGYHVPLSNWGTSCLEDVKKLTLLILLGFSF